jgi:hypothetical protein
VIILQIAGIAITVIALWSGYSSIRTEYLFALRQEAHLRRLRRWVHVEAKRRAAAGGDAQIWANWAEGKAQRERKRLRLPQTTWDDLNHLRAFTGRAVVAQAFQGSKSALTAALVGFGFSSASTMLDLVSSFSS